MYVFCLLQTNFKAILWFGKWLMFTSLRMNNKCLKWQLNNITKDNILICSSINFVDVVENVREATAWCEEKYLQQSNAQRIEHDKTEKELQYIAIAYLEKPNYELRLKHLMDNGTRRGCRFVVLLIWLCCHRQSYVSTLHFSHEYIQIQHTIWGFVIGLVITWLKRTRSLEIYVCRMQ